MPRLSFHHLLLTLLAAALACRLPSAPTTEAPPPPATTPPSIATPAPPSPTPTHAPTSPAPASPTSTLEPTPTITHLMRPSAPGSVQSFITDFSTKPYASQRRSNVDNFDWNNYERPFTSQVMDYQPYLDLVRAELSAVSPWIYVTLFLEEPPPTSAPARYALEFDLDIDGRGDWLITALLPTSSTWTTDGVQVYQDTNNDVGGPHPLRADPPPQPTPTPGYDGYDRLVFDHGLGDDPDAAWVRLSPTSPNQIQIALKHALLAFDDYLLWGAWADDGSPNPAWFDFNDHFTIAEAGSPYPPSPHYPIQQLASLDNTCRAAFNFTPTGNLPGICPPPSPQTPAAPGTPTATPTKPGGTLTPTGPGTTATPTPTKPGTTPTPTPTRPGPTPTRTNTPTYVRPSPTPTPVPPSPTPTSTYVRPSPTPTPAGPSPTPAGIQPSPTPRAVLPRTILSTVFRHNGSNDVLPPHRALVRLQWNAPRLA